MQVAAVPAGSPAYAEDVIDIDLIPDLVLCIGGGRMDARVAARHKNFCHTHEAEGPPAHRIHSAAAPHSWAAVDAARGAAGGEGAPISAVQYAPVTPTTDAPASAGAAGGGRPGPAQSSAVGAGTYGSAGIFAEQTFPRHGHGSSQVYMNDVMRYIPQRDGGVAAPLGDQRPPPGLRLPSAHAALVIGSQVGAHAAFSTTDVGSWHSSINVRAGAAQLSKPGAQQDVRPAGDAADALPLFGHSRGSLGHPELCTRPCLFKVSGTCVNGSSCEFCHEHHPDAPAKLDKRHQERLLALPPRGALDLALPLLRQKVLNTTSDPQSYDAFLRLCEVCGVAGGAAAPVGNIPSGQRSVAKMLAAMNCRRLVIMLQRTLLRECPEARAAAEDLVQRMLAAAR